MALYVRFRRNGDESLGVLGDGSVRAIDGDLLGDHTEVGPEIPLDAINYQSHVPSGSALTKSDEAPAVPQLFLKPASSIARSDETILLPEGAPRVDAEGELVAVIGRLCKGVSESDALDYVFGFTCGNDVSARHWQRDDLQWWRAKGSDTFTPIGPAIATGLDPNDLELRTRVNGEEMQAGNTGEMVHSAAKLISFASQVMTLEPGDLIFTGTPGVPPKLNDGDVVEVEIDGIGVLRNPVGR
jgi:2-keto-4-pentenoate hydratase/2-oxohepta-3-ene-1,7-dioic acid hydratase in catechol pathway